MDGELLKPKEVGRMIRRPENWLAKARMTGAGPSFLKIGGKVLYRRAAVDAWLARCERNTTGEPRAA